MAVLRMRGLSAIIRMLSVAVLVALLLPDTALALSPSAPLANFSTEAQAHQHCPTDTVVWLNLPTGIYHFNIQG